MKSLSPFIKSWLHSFSLSLVPIASSAKDRAEAFLHPIIALLARAFGEAGLLSYTVVICEGRLQQSKQSTLNY